MSGKVKESKTARQAVRAGSKGKAQQETASTFVAVSSGYHRIVDFPSGRTKCGLRFNGWHAGVPGDIVCEECLQKDDA